MRCDFPYIPDRIYENETQSINESMNIFKTKESDHEIQGSINKHFSKPIKNVKLEYYKLLILILFICLIYITTL